MAKKRDLHRSKQKRQAIRVAAYRCFRERGYGATTVDSVCAEIGISKGSFYWHYPSKLDVFVDIIETWTREIMDELYEQFEDAVLTADYETAVIDALQRETRRGHAVVPLWLEFSVLGRHEPEIQRALAKFYRRARSALVEILRPVMEGRCSDSEIRSAAAVLFGAYAGLMLQALSDPERLDATEQIDLFMGTLKKFLPRVGADLGSPDV